MANNVLSFKRREVEARGPQLEDGYFRIANDLGEAFAAVDLTSRQQRIIWAVLRLTYGWGRKTARITGTDLAKLTGFRPNRCSEVVAELLERRVLFRIGSSRSPLGINKHFDEWQDKPTGKRETPQNGVSHDRVPEGGDSPQNGEFETPQNGVTYKDRKDITGVSNDTPSGSPAGDAAAEDDESSSASPPPETATPAKAPPCPHQDILAAWAEVMPDKRQPTPSLWSDSKACEALRARWKQVWGMRKATTGEPLYQTQAEGIEWWSKFFAFLRKSAFLMDDENKWFGLDWVVRRENFRKVYELKYHRPHELQGGVQ